MVPSLHLFTEAAPPVIEFTDLQFLAIFNEMNGKNAITRLRLLRSMER